MDEQEKRKAPDQMSDRVPQEVLGAVREFLRTHYRPQAQQMREKSRMQRPYEEDVSQSAGTADLNEQKKKDLYQNQKQLEQRIWKEADEDEEIPESRIELKNARPFLSSPEAWPEIQNAVRHVGQNFQQKLLELIADRGMTEVEVYRRAQIDRKLFSKIRRNPDYTPKKSTVLALALVLKLSLDETTDLLSRAGEALSPGSKRDLIVEYCIRKRIYNLFEVNAILYAFDEPTLP